MKPARRGARSRRRAWALLIAGATVALACGREPERSGANDERAAALERLRAFETARRAETDFRTRPPATTGPDPVDVRWLPAAGRLVGLLRGRSALVLLDADGREIARVAAPTRPAGLAVTASEEILVAGELAPEIARYRVRDGALVRTGTLPLPGIRSVRDIATGPEGVIYVVEDHDHRLVTLAAGEAGAILDGGDAPIGLGPRTVLRTRRHVVVDCILSHEVVVLPVDARGVPLRADAVRVVHDGPLWAVDAIETGDDLLLALGGVENRPLDRRQGSFGYIDSFAWIYRVPPAGQARPLAEVNLSAWGVVVPKVVRVRAEGDDVRLRATGYGSATLAELAWKAPQPTRRGTWPAPAATTRAFVPGTVAETVTGDGRRVFADPLLDAWVIDDGTEPRVVPVADGEVTRSLDSRVGEALLSTTLIAPWNRTRGALSRFTCETCHFEGGVDGRIHDPGRGDLHVTTKPLTGLFENRPYFSRALDPDLTAVAHNEFRVAGLRSRHDSWFTIGVADAPWLAHLGVGAEPLGPEALRRAFMVFLMESEHRPNPATQGRSTWSDPERRGAEVFRDRCERCHEARLVTDRPDSRVPFAEWERLVFAPAGPIVWAHAAYERTGIEPYVHAQGARVPSLRRLYRKRPYFTNGSSPDLDDVLRRARFEGTTFRHDGGDAGTRLDPAEREALLAFLDLL